CARFSVVSATAIATPYFDFW
nr:immunoglobulin heavy chain junction region [Macaca mulatta]